jgi:hypothetical protein
MALTLARAAKYHGPCARPRQGNIMKIIATVLATCLAIPASFAQEPQVGVARLKDVQGNVLVSRESGLGAGTEGMRLVKGVRVITTSKSGVIVAYDNGCDVKLKENERFEVETGKPCAALVSAPQSILATPAGATVAAAAGATAGYLALLPALGGAAAALAALRGRRESQPVSPS